MNVVLFSLFLVSVCIRYFLFVNWFVEEDNIVFLSNFTIIIIRVIK